MNAPIVAAAVYGGTPVAWQAHVRFIATMNSKLKLWVGQGYLWSHNMKSSQDIDTFPRSFIAVICIYCVTELCMQKAKIDKHFKKDTLHILYHTQKHRGKNNTRLKRHLMRDLFL